MGNKFVSTRPGCRINDAPHINQKGREGAKFCSGVFWQNAAKQITSDVQIIQSYSQVQITLSHPLSFSPFAVRKSNLVHGSIKRATLSAVVALFSERGAIVSVDWAAAEQ